MSGKDKKESFPGQRPDEQVELVFHRHPIVMRKALIIGALILLVGSIPGLVAPSHYNGDLKALGVAGIVTLLFWIYEWVGWYYTVYILTTQRLIEVKQKGFFNRRVREFPLDKIQNVNYHIKGFMAVVFHFGTITAQTYVGDVVMDTIHKPVETHQKIISVIRTVEPSTPVTT